MKNELTENGEKIPHSEENTSSCQSYIIRKKDTTTFNNVLVESRLQQLAKYSPRNQTIPNVRIQ